MIGRPGISSGTLTLDRDGVFDGMITGMLIVAPGRTVEVSGMVNGALVVGEGAVVRVTGMVNGGIRNDGGRVIVEGMANPA